MRPSVFRVGMLLGRFMPMLDIQLGPFALDSGAHCSGLHANKLPEVREHQCAVRKNETRSCARLPLRTAQTGVHNTQRHRDRAQRAATGCVLAASEYAPSQYVGVSLGNRTCNVERSHRHVDPARAHVHGERRKLVSDDAAGAGVGKGGRVSARSRGRFDLGIE